MYINEKTKGKNSAKSAINDAGGMVVQDEIYRAFMLFAATLNLKKEVFYKSNNEELKTFIDMTNTLIKKDPAYVFGCVDFLTNIHGRKLAPAVVAAVAMSKENEQMNNQLGTFISKCFSDRPDKIANTFALYKKLKNNNSFTKGVHPFIMYSFKKVFESYNENTLTKFKMKGKEIKLKDLIKTLKPRPRNEKMSAVYKDIIEDGPLSKLNKNKDFIAIISDNSKTESEKQEAVDLKTAPINAIIRNLQFISGMKNEDKKIVYERLNSIISDDKAWKYFNIFDLFFASDVVSKDEELNKILNKIIVKFCMKYSDFFYENENIGIMQDVSGSMGYEKRDKSAKLIAILLIVAQLSKANVKKYFFEQRLIDWSTNYEGMLPLDLYTYIRREMDKYSGGTSLYDCFATMVKNDEYDRVFVISDEMTWADNKVEYNYWGSSTQKRMQEVIDKNKLKMIFYNPDYTDGKVVISSNKVTRISELSTSMFSTLDLYTGSIEKFKKFIKQNYKY